ncbi:MAG TPA: nucleotidyltransferase family protein [Candidatus Moranbacteria bacterium]|nr:nucleotidyltransferase family protein [Candidatus Moranbacteria bacterium]
MSTEQIEQKLIEAIEKDPHKKDMKKVSLFGSYIYGQPREDSDVDVLVEFEPNSSISLFDLVHIRRNFSEFIGKKVDLLTPSALSKYFRDEVLAKAKTIYEK